MRDRLAVASGKVAGRLTRAMRIGGGTAIPGLTAYKLSPGVLGRLLAQIPQGFIFVSGTNGKTTTTAMLSRILSVAGYDVLTNRTGSNLIRGLISHLIERTGPLGSLRVEDNSIGVFEVDEAALIEVLPDLRPRIVLLTNLFRDQLDRYGEIDSISNAWGRIIAETGETMRVVVNADDPAVMQAGARSTGEISTFSVRNDDGGALPDEWADSASCPACSATLAYRSLNYSHLGDYECPNCGFERPVSDFEAIEIHADGLNPASFSLRHRDFCVPIELNLPGVFNVYNALSAAATAFPLGVTSDAVQTGLQGFKPAFGRAERIVVDGVELVLLLVKNPAGANEVVRSLRQDSEPADYLIALNDRAADGEDVSWIWDIEFEGLHANRIVVTGDRAADLALRLKYAGLAGSDVMTVETSHESALARVLSGDAARVNILATYTAMLELRDLLVRRGNLEPYWSA